MPERLNPDLDDFMAATEDVNSTRLPKQKRRRKRPATSKDLIRRHAFRVLAAMAGLEANDRERVLRLAMRLNKAN